MKKNGYRGVGCLILRTRNWCASRLRAHNLNRLYNGYADEDEAQRQECLRKLLGGIGGKCLLQGPIYFHYGAHTRLGDTVFASFNFTVQDDAAVTIGNNCDFGPNVTIVTPVHPMLPQERRAMRKANGEVRQLCYALPCASATIAGSAQTQ